VTGASGRPLVAGDAAAGLGHDAEEDVCEAIDSIADARRAARPSVTPCSATPPGCVCRCLHGAGPLSVSDPAVAADLNSGTVLQTLRLLRANQTITTERVGRVIRFRLADPTVERALNL
jgi:hypothetical protein